MKNLLYLTTFILTLNSCAQQSKWEPKEFSLKVCDCFEKLNQGSIDERLDPCFSSPINENIDLIHTTFYPEKTSEDALYKYMTDVTIELVRNCDKFYNEINSMYSEFYPKIDFDTVQKSIIELTDSITSNDIPDSTKIKLLHKRISLYTKARKFENALNDIKIMSSEFGNVKETHFVSAYIFMSQKEYEKALEQIDLAIKYDNPDYILYKELIKRRKNSR